MNIVEMMLSAVKTQVCGAPSESFGNISQENMAMLYELSKAHDMAHIVATELEAQGLLDDSDVCNKFRKQQFIALMRYERINYELEEICKLFEAEKIDHIPLKGSVMRRYYSQPWMRTSADIDMLVKEEDAERAEAVLIARLEYRSEKSNTGYDLSMFAPSGVHLELHYDVVEKRSNKEMLEILSSIWEHSHTEAGWNYRYLTDDDIFYFYHVAHAQKHFSGSGCGVRLFLDMWLLCHGVKYDKEKREALLQKGGLLKFAQASEQLAEVWFSGAEHDELTACMESYIIAGGIYGTNENRIANIQIKKGGKIGYAMSRIFLPYKTMVQHFPSLEKRKLLLPFYHVFRWGRIIFGGGVKRSVNELKTSARVADTRTDEIQAMLEELGL